MPVTVGVIGCGSLGAALARRLLLCGFPVVVWNRTASRATHLARQGAALARDAADCASRCQVVLLCVPGEAWEQVVAGREGIVGGARPATILVGCGTATPGICQAIAATWATTGGWCDAALVGDVAQIDRGSALLLAGGAAPDIEAVRPVLSALADPVVAVGGVGDGHAARERLIQQDAAIAAAWSAVAGNPAMAQAQAVAARRTIERLAANPPASPVTGRTVKPVKAVTVGLPLPELPLAILPEVPAGPAVPLPNPPAAPVPPAFARPPMPDPPVVQPATSSIARSSGDAVARPKAVTIATAPPPTPFVPPERPLAPAPEAPTADELGPRQAPPSADWERMGEDWRRRYRNHRTMVTVASAIVLGCVLMLIGGLPGLVTGAVVGAIAVLLIGALRLSHLSGSAIYGVLTAAAIFAVGGGPIGAFIGAIGGCVLGVVMTFWLQGMD
jgi:3-hydroxyisobutyrate dehydrogenase-like beta-hydroxyacid dehydrogenase